MEGNIFSLSNLIDLLESLSLEIFPSDTALPSITAILSGRTENKTRVLNPPSSSLLLIVLSQPWCLSLQGEGHHPCL